MKTTVKKEALYELAFNLPDKNCVKITPFTDDVSKIIVMKYGVIDQNGNEIVKPIFEDYIIKFKTTMVAWNSDYCYIINDNECKNVNQIFKKVKRFYDDIAIIEHENNVGVIDKNGNYIIEAQYEDLIYCNDCILIYKKNGKYGLLTLDEVQIIEPRYDFIRICGNGTFAFRDKDKWGLLTKTGRVLITASFDNIESFYDDKYVVRVDKKYGIINKNNEVIVAPQFDKIGLRSKDGLTFIGRDKKYGFINKEGEIVIDLKFDESSFALTEFHEGVAEVKQNGKKILINTKGETINTPELNYIGRFSNGVALVEGNNKYGFMDKTGQIVIPLIYDDAHGFRNGFAPVKENNKWHFINIKNEKAFEGSYDLIPYPWFYESKFTLVGKKIFKFVNHKGETLFSIDCDWCSDFHDGVAWFKKENKYGFINKKGEIIIQPILDNVGAERNVNVFEGWLITIKQQDKVGIVYKGKNILPPCYDRIDFSGKIFIAKEGNRYKMFDLQGNFIKNLPIEHLEGFGRNSPFRQNGKYGIIDGDGKILIKAKYDSLGYFSNGFAPFRNNKKWGYLNLKGEEIIEAQFDYCSYFINGYAEITLNKKKGLIDTSGKIIIHPKFDVCEVTEDGFFCCRLNDTLLYYDNNLKLINKIPMDIYSSHFNNLIKIKQGDKFGLIKKNGELVLKPEYDEISSYSAERILTIKQNDKYGIIGKDGKIIIKPIFGYIYYDYHTKGISIFESDGKFGFIDKDGNILIAPLYDRLGAISEGYAGFGQFSHEDHRYIRGFIKIFNNLNDYISYKLKDIESENEYVSARVENKISQWSKKGEFEKTMIWKERIGSKKKEKITELITKYKEEYQAKVKEHVEQKKSLRAKYFELKEKQIRAHFIPEKLQLSRYDADNETFLILADEGYGKVVLHVPIEIAPGFKENWETIRKTADLEFIATEDIELKTLTFYYSDKNIVYDSSEDAEYNYVVSD